jgi:hypothetical protein
MKIFSLYFLSFFFLACGLLRGNEIATEGKDLTVETHQTAGAFPLVNDGNNAKILFDADDAAVVKTVAEALDKDIALVTGT